MNKLSVFTKMLYALLCLGVSQRSIAQTPEYDIAIGMADTNGVSYFEKGDFVRVGGNCYNAGHNLSSDLKEWFWGAKIVNKGYKDILPSAHPRIRMNIDYTNPTSGLVTYNVYTDTIIGSATDTVKAAETNSLALVAYLRDINFIINIYREGEYTVTYWVQHDSTDGYTTNDTIRHSFEIVPDWDWLSPPAPIKNYTSKARLDPIDGKVAGSTIFFPAGAPHNSLEYGSVYYFPQYWVNALKLDSVEFRYHVPSNFSGDSNQVFLVNIYLYEDGNANGFLDDTSEITLTGIAGAFLTGLGSTIPNDSNAIETVSGFIDPVTGEPMTDLVLGGFYYISILTYPYLFNNNGPETFGYNDVAVLLSDKINYAMNIGMTSSAAPILPSVLIVTDSTGSTMHTLYDKVPSIGIYTDFYHYISIDKLATTENKNLSLYPNPTTHHLNIQTTLPEPTDVQYIITDLTGRVFYIYNKKNSSNDIHTVDVSALSAGVYLVSAKTEKGVSTERFVKQ